MAGSEAGLDRSVSVSVCPGIIRPRSFSKRFKHIALEPIMVI